MPTFNMSEPRTYSALYDVVKASPKLLATMTYKDGHTRTVRLAISTVGSILELAPRSQRHGYRFDTYGVESVTLADPKSKPVKTKAQEYVADLIARRNYLRKHCYPGVWPDLVAEMEGMDQSKLDTLAAADCDSHYAAWEMAHDLGLPQIEPHKTKTLPSCGCPARYLPLIANAFAARTPFEFFWRDKYDYHVEGKVSPDGAYRAWLSEEFKDCGNGHYWLLISPLHAIFAEDD